MKAKTILASGLLILFAGALAAGVRYWSARDPDVITLDPRIYDEYAGHYDFGNNYVITIRRTGDRLMSFAPEQMPRQLLPETSTTFFVRGEPGRITFHRANGQVNYLTFRRKKFEDKAQRLSSYPPGLECTNAMIAATTGGKPVEAGLAILKEGGSAVDAALAVALCQIVQAAGSYVSFAGPMMLLYYEASSGGIHYLDAQYNIPLNEKDPHSIPKKGGRTALVPGFMAGIQEAHARFGKLPFPRIFEEAIALADEGQTVTPAMEWWINEKKRVLSRHPETKEIFTRPDGKFFMKGDLFRQSALAATLKGIQRGGVSYMYDGPWGRKFVDIIQQNGGKITLEDMKRYKAIWEKPLETSYREYRVYAPGISAWGGVNTIEGLNLLELANLKQWGHYTQSAESLLWLVHISRVHHLTWRQPESARHDLSPKSRVTKETSAWIWQQMQNRTWDWLPKRIKKPASSHTDALVVVDRDGNMSVLNHTINTSLWGNTGIFVDGISIPDSAAVQAQEIAAAGAGKRLPIGMSPVIVLRDGKAVLGLSTTGAGLHPKLLQTLINILDFGMDPQTAVDTPCLVGDGSNTESGAFDPKLLEATRKLGADIHVLKPEQTGAVRGYCVNIQVDPATQRMRGGVSRGLNSDIQGY